MLTEEVSRGWRGRGLERIPVDLEGWNGFGENYFPGLLGIHVVEVCHGRCRLRFQASSHQAPHGYLHGGAVVALADTACGYGCLASLPEGATGLTTIELKANFLGTVNDGAVLTDARLLHAGRRTQVWDAAVMVEQTHRTIAVLRCSQMILYPVAAQ